MVDLHECPAAAGEGHDLPDPPAREAKPAADWIDVLKAVAAPARNNDAKRSALKAALANEKLARWSSRRLAMHLGLDPSWVARVRRELTGARPDPAKAKAARASNAGRNAAGPDPVAAFLAWAVETNQLDPDQAGALRDGYRQATGK